MFSSRVRTTSSGAIDPEVGRVAILCTGPRSWFAFLVLSSSNSTTVVSPFSVWISSSATDLLFSFKLSRSDKSFPSRFKGSITWDRGTGIECKVMLAWFSPVVAAPASELTGRTKMIWGKVLGCVSKVSPDCWFICSSFSCRLSRPGDALKIAIGFTLLVCCFFLRSCVFFIISEQT